MSKLLDESLDLDALFNQLINAKEVAVDTAQEAYPFASPKELVGHANSLLDQLREKFKTDITLLMLKAQKEELETVRGFYDISRTSRAKVVT